jgi:membrane-associated phospholipid phosphatase
MRIQNLIVAASALIVIFSGGAGKAADRIERAGDVLQVLIPSFGYGLTHYLDDRSGRVHFTKSFLATSITTHILKSAINAERPNGGSRSFPSGHTSSAFQGAAFVHARYGIELAWPMYAAAAFVGYSRVDAGKHHVRDVLAGAALGITTSFYFTPDRFELTGTVFLPYADNEKIGFVWMRTLE